MILGFLAMLAAAQTAPSPSCVAPRAVAADVRVMARAQEQWLGRCVRLQGYVIGNIFYADAGGAYAAAASDRDDRRNDGWLGVYVPGRWPRTLRAGSVTGILHDCGRDWQEEDARAGPNEIVMSLGYCHYRSGLVLLDAQFRDRGPARFERLTDAASRQRFGDLDPASPDLRPPPEVVALADRFLVGARAGDGTSLATFTETWTEQPPRTPAAVTVWLEYLSGAGTSPLAFLRRADVQRAYFRERAPREDFGVAYRPDWFACFCRAGDCTGRWPIHGADATVGANRPYICVRAYNGTDRREPPDRLAINRSESMFAEPPANSSTR